MNLRAARTFVLTVLAAMIGSADSQPRPSPSPSASMDADRPVQVIVPAGYSTTKPAPLLLMLHGYGGSASNVEAYLQFKQVAQKAGALYVLPQGTTDDRGARFWNAWPACCDFRRTGINDSAYLRTVITQLQARYAVDPKRIFVAGWSNGGFMAHRLACDHADLIAGIMSLAGVGPLSPAECKPSQPVAVLQIHGDRDTVIRYEGGRTGAAYPSAEQSARDWAVRNGCVLTPRTGVPQDLAVGADNRTPALRRLDGPETTIRVYGQGCKAGGHVEMWTVVGADHGPAFSEGFAQRVMNFLLAHPKP